MKSQLNGTTSGVWIALAVLFCCARAQAAPGDLDPSFGGDGKETIAIGSVHDNAYDMALQGDDRIVLAGSSFNGSDIDFAVVGFNTDGTLDMGFGGGGKVTTVVGPGNDSGVNIEVQSDARIVVAGYADIGGNLDFALVRYNPDGSLDISFGVGGKVTTDLTGGQDVANSVVLQSDGKIIAAGTAAPSGAFEMARYNTNGSLDTTFNGTGKSVITFGAGGGQCNSVALQSDEKILLAGWASIGGTDDFVVARYHGSPLTGTPGTLDASFGSGGVTTTSIGSGFDGAEHVTVQSDGKILVAGFAHIGGISRFAIVRYNDDGTLDTSFNSTDHSGKVTTVVGSSDTGRKMAVQSNGKILLTGESLNGGSYDFAMVRYETDGSLDPSFGSAGKVFTDFAGSDDVASSIALRGDGRIVVAGYASNGINFDFAVVRYENDLPLPDTIPPVISSIAASPNLLGPPNNKLVPVTVAVSATDDDGQPPSCQIIGVSSNEPIVSGDAVITGALTLKLRADRLGKGSGRVYTITVRCTDQAGNASDGVVIVTVPHDRRKS